MSDGLVADPISNEKRRHDWLAERSRWAGVSVSFDSAGVYRCHTVNWYVPGAWLRAEGQSFEEAVDNAIKVDQHRELTPIS